RMTRDGIFFIDSRVGMKDITDGTSNTFLFGERYHRDPEFDRLHDVVCPGSLSTATRGMWGYVANAGAMANVTLSTPQPINYRVPSGGVYSGLGDRSCAFGSGRPGGSNFAFPDGSVRFLSESTPLETLRALSTRAGGEAVTLP